MKKRRLLEGASESIGDDWNARRHSFVDAVFQQRGIGDGNQDPGRFFLHRLIKCVTLSFGVVGLRPGEIGTHLKLPGGIGEARFQPPSSKAVAGWR